MKKAFRIAIILSVVFVLLIVLFYRASSRHALIYILPDQYHGWVQIAYGVKGRPPLPMEHGAYILTFTDTKRIETSTPIEYGYARDEHYYFREGKRIEIDENLVRFDRFDRTSISYIHEQNGVITSKSPEIESQFFGTESDFNKNPASPRWRF